MKDSRDFAETVMKDEQDFERVKWAAPYAEKVAAWIAGVCDRGLDVEEAKQNEMIDKDRFIREQLRAAHDREERLLALLERLASK